MSLIQTSYSPNSDTGTPLLRGMSVPPAAIANPRFRSEWLGVEDIGNDLLREWRNLAHAASEPNPFFEPHLLIPALTHLHGASSVRLLAIRDRLMANRLIGLAPIRLTPTYCGIPVQTARTWKHVHTFLATPLLRSGHESDGLQVLLTALHAKGVMLLRLHHMAADGPVARALTNIAHASKLKSVTTRRFVRALLHSSAKGDDYLTANVSKKKRKEYSRLSRRLADQGEVTFQTPDTTDPAVVEGVVLEFLELERSGWKGSAGTAIAERPVEARFFLNACREAARTGHLEPLTLRLDGKPIASIINFKGGSAQGSGLFSFKIAHDEAYSRFSPGVLLELELTSRALATPGVVFTDSCADPNHPMINHIWGERRVMQDITIATSPYVPASVLMATASMETAIAAVKSHMKRIISKTRHHLLKRNTS